MLADYFKAKLFLKRDLPKVTDLRNRAKTILKKKRKKINDSSGPIKFVQQSENT